MIIFSTLHLPLTDLLNSQLELLSLEVDGEGFLLYLLPSRWILHRLLNLHVTQQCLACKKGVPLVKTLMGKACGTESKLHHCFLQLLKLYFCSFPFTSRTSPEHSLKHRQLSPLDYTTYEGEMSRSCLFICFELRHAVLSDCCTLRVRYWRLDTAS